MNNYLFRLQIYALKFEYASVFSKKINFYLKITDLFKICRIIMQNVMFVALHIAVDRCGFPVAKQPFPKWLFRNSNFFGCAALL